jgi:hypothetical protein
MAIFSTITRLDHKNKEILGMSAKNSVEYNQLYPCKNSFFTNFCLCGVRVKNEIFHWSLELIIFNGVFRTHSEYLFVLMIQSCYSRENRHIRVNFLQVPIEKSSIVFEKTRIQGFSGHSLGRFCRPK